MHSSRIRILVLAACVLGLGSSLAARTVPASDEQLPIELSESQVQAISSLGVATPIAAEALDAQNSPQQQSAVPVTPALLETQFREVVQKLSKQKHQFVHCKLTNGKVFTGHLREIAGDGFSIQTEALGGEHYVRYRELAEAPRTVPAVGTHIKIGAQWTGVVALTIVLTPILLPLLLTGVLAD